MKIDETPGPSIEVMFKCSKIVYRRTLSPHRIVTRKSDSASSRIESSAVCRAYILFILLDCAFDDVEKKSIQIELNELIKKSVNGLKIKKYPKYTYPFFNYINYNLTSRYLNTNQTDILHLTYYDKVYNLKKKVKKILTIYDLIHEKFNYYYLNN